MSTLSADERAALAELAPSTGRREGGSIHTVYTARKRYTCDWGCTRPIEPGDRYVRAVLPPGVDNNDGWVTLRGHGHTLYGCPWWVHPNIDETTERMAQ